MGSQIVIENGALRETFVGVTEGESKGVIVK